MKVRASKIRAIKLRATVVRAIMVRVIMVRVPAASPPFLPIQTLSLPTAPEPRLTRSTAWLEPRPSMTQPSPSFVHELLTERLDLLRALAGSLEQAQASLATATPEKLDQYTARQQELCRQLRSLAAGFSELKSRPYPALEDDLQATARRVGDLNRKYAALLRRKRRTVDISCRVLASSGTTYPAPKLLSRPALKATTPKG
jgi:hypothetical protein